MNNHSFCDPHFFMPLSLWILKTFWLHLSQLCSLSLKAPSLDNKTHENHPPIWKKSFTHDYFIYLYQYRCYFNYSMQCIFIVLCVCNCVLALFCQSTLETLFSEAAWLSSLSSGHRPSTEFTRHDWCFLSPLLHCRKVGDNHLCAFCLRVYAELFLKLLILV